jgi:hypothetical protein
MTTGVVRTGLAGTMAGTASGTSPSRRDTGGEEGYDAPFVQDLRSGRAFSENRGQPFFKLRISYEQLYRILTTLVQCGSARGTAKASGVSVNTVLRIIRIAGAHARGFSSTTSCFRGSG